MVALPPLEPHSSTPLYRQLYANVRDAIRQGVIRTGDRLPPTRELAQLAGVNRATVAAAYELLEHDGLIRGHVGRGSYVMAAPAAADAEPALISFATSRPAENLFPMGEFRETVEEVLADPGLSRVLQLGAPAGLPELKSALLEYSGDDILITSGCQQALDLIARSFCGFGDTVLVEDPVYAGLRNVFERHQARLIGLPVGDHGIDADAFAAAIERERPRLAIVCPDFQNPTGATLPREARIRIGEAAARANVPLVEIDIYRDLRYRGTPTETIKKLVPAAHVLLVRSFSKVAFPGMRIGWIQAPRASVARLVETKQWTDLHSDQLSQAIMLRFLQSGRLAKHRERVVRAGAASLDALLASCAASLPAGTRVSRPEGGMSAWVTLPARLNAEELLVTAKRMGVSYLPGQFFAVNRPCPSSLRLSFAGLAPEAVRQGVAALGRACQEEMARERLIESPAVAMV